MASEDVLFEEQRRAVLALLREHAGVDLANDEEEARGWVARLARSARIGYQTLWNYLSGRRRTLRALSRLVVALALELDLPLEYVRKRVFLGEDQVAVLSTQFSFRPSLDSSELEGLAQHCRTSDVAHELATAMHLAQDLRSRIPRQSKTLAEAETVYDLPETAFRTLTRYTPHTFDHYFMLILDGLREQDASAYNQVMRSFTRLTELLMQERLQKGSLPPDEMQLLQNCACYVVGLGPNNAAEVIVEQVERLWASNQDSVPDSFLARDVFRASTSRAHFVADSAGAAGTRLFDMLEMSLYEESEGVLAHVTLGCESLYFGGANQLRRGEVIPSITNLRRDNIGSLLGGITNHLHESAFELSILNYIITLNLMFRERNDLPRQFSRQAFQRLHRSLIERDITSLSEGPFAKASEEVMDYLAAIDET